MRISFRLLLGYFLIVGLAAWFVLNVFSNEVKPGVRQTMEETLVDTATLLAEIAVTDMSTQTFNATQFNSTFKRYQSRKPHANIWGFKKDQVGLRVYITNARGIVLYDSTGKDVGRDYSKWNDVYNTLHGQYGARSTRDIANDERSSVMYVAAPIIKNQQIIGSLTVAKPTISVQPFIDRSQQRILQAGWWLMGGALLIGGLITWWLTHSISLLRRYAKNVRLNGNEPLPNLGTGELAELGKALADMRTQLDGRVYIENYVQHLTHEMKSPLTAIIGSAELLQEKMTVADRKQFASHIHTQSLRLKMMIDALLNLATLEQKRLLTHVESTNAHDLIDNILSNLKNKSIHKQLVISNNVEVTLMISGEVFLLKQAFNNLIENAIEFSNNGGIINIGAEIKSSSYTFVIEDNGVGIPDYALPRIFERFYSLPRPDTNTKSTGLGLAFVHEIAKLHHGEVHIRNRANGGAIAELTISIG